MLPIALLLNEHGIIKLTVDTMKKKLETPPEQFGQQITPEFIDIAVDFFRIYSDKCHHGKEENILFRELAKKQLSPEHKKIMDELVTEHIYARETVNALAQAQKKYAQGKAKALAEIQTILKSLVAFYPKHVEKEETRFFYPSMEYFNTQELDSMVDECLRFDANIIHIKYIETAEQLMSL